MGRRLLLLHRRARRGWLRCGPKGLATISLLDRSSPSMVPDAAAGSVSTGGTPPSEERGPTCSRYCSTRLGPLVLLVVVSK